MCHSRLQNMIFKMKPFAWPSQVLQLVVANSKVKYTSNFAHFQSLNPEPTGVDQMLQAQRTSFWYSNTNQ